MPLITPECLTRVVPPLRQLSALGVWWWRGLHTPALERGQFSNRDACVIPSKGYEEHRLAQVDGGEKASHLRRLRSVEYAIATTVIIPIAELLLHVSAWSDGFGIHSGVGIPWCLLFH